MKYEKFWKELISKLDKDQVKRAKKRLKSGVKLLCRKKANLWSDGKGNC